MAIGSGRRIIITFHGIGSPPRLVPSEESDYWVPLDHFREILDLVRLRGDIEITFDDGNSSDLELALPELHNRSLGASFFVLLGRLGQRGALTEDAVRELRNHGMAVGSHGRRHCDWRMLAPPVLSDEIATTRHELESVLRAPVTSSACPFGSYDRRVLRELKHAGYTTVFTSDGGTARIGAWLQPRNTITRVNAALFSDLLRGSGRHRLARAAKLTAKRWR